jgi:hypothetical protein
MRRGLTGLVQVPLLVLASSLAFQAALSAQRAGATGSIASGHFGGAVHAGPAPTFTGASRGIAPSVHAPSPQSGPPRHWPGGVPTHPTGGNRNGRNGYPAIYAGYPWLAFGYGVPLGYSMPYGGDPDDAEGPSPVPQQPADEAAVDYGTEPPGPPVTPNGATSFRPSYQGSYPGPSQGPYEMPSQAAPVHVQPTTILIFKDGRPPEKVHNYALTGSTLYALDGDMRQEIPLALLNVPATVEVNRAAGVDFSLPVSR